MQNKDKHILIISKKDNKIMAKRLTPKKQKLVRGLVENITRQGKALPLGKVMLNAGYSKASSTNPSQFITPDIMAKVNPIIAKMESIRNRALDNITDEKLRYSTARDNTYVADILTKNSQLLQGNATEIVHTTSLTKEEQDKLLDLLK